MLEDYHILIDSLNKKFEFIFGRDFKLKPSHTDACSLVRYNNVGYTKAINRLDGGYDSEVDVYNWFGSYYIYIEVKLIFSSIVPHGKRKKVRI